MGDFNKMINDKRIKVQWLDDSIVNVKSRISCCSCDGELNTCDFNYCPWCGIKFEDNSSVSIVNFLGTKYTNLFIKDNTLYGTSEYYDQPSIIFTQEIDRVI